MCKKAVAKCPRDVEPLITYALALAHTDSGEGEQLRSAFSIAERCHHMDKKNARVIDGRRQIHELKYAWENRPPEDECDELEFDILEETLPDGTVRRTTVRRSRSGGGSGDQGEVAVEEKKKEAAIVGREFEDGRGWEWTEAQKAARSAAIALSGPDGDVDVMLAQMEAARADDGLDEHGKSRKTVIRMPVLEAKREMQRQEAELAVQAAKAVETQLPAGVIDNVADAKVAQAALMQATKSQLFNSSDAVGSAQMATIRAATAEAKGINTADPDDVDDDAVAARTMASTAARSRGNSVEGLQDAASDVC